MRRNLEEVGAEIFRRRDEYREKVMKRRKLLRTAVPAACGALAVMLAVGVMSTLNKNAMPEASRPGGDREDTVQETENYNNHGGTNGTGGDTNFYGNTVEPTVESGTDAELPPWICGTPGLNGGFFEPEFISAGSYSHSETRPDGGILLFYGEEENTSVMLGAEDAAAFYRMVLSFSSTDGEPDYEKQPVLTLNLQFGNRLLRCIRYENGVYLINENEMCSADAETDAALEALAESLLRAAGR